MTELDHIILFCARGAPEAEALKAHGLLEGSGKSHQGQGTANRRFFFANFYLELVWVENEAEAQSNLVRPTQLWDRWSGRDSGLCPFGLVFRPGNSPVATPPFPAWSYRPAYLPADLSIEVGIGVTPFEPLLFYLPFAGNRRPPLSEPLDHPALATDLLGVRLHLRTSDRLSPALESLVAAGLLTVAAAPKHLLELTVASGRSTSIDLRPELPLILHRQSTE